jgi:arginyl-tRNA--protein-N-Asp/Glu arginylyltransferase
MFTEKHHLNYLSPKDLDQYLERGWFRMVQTVFTCQFLFFEGAIFSTIWIRRNLKNLAFTKSQRKLIQRNKNQFSFEFGPLNIDRNKETLFHKYRKSFKGSTYLSLSSSLFEPFELAKVLFNSYECRVYDGDKLIALSIFDLGNKSLASIIGIYDPDYKAHSLGLFTMFLEMEFGKSQGFEFYYPGYIIPPNTRFNYKLRIGEAEFLDQHSKQWLPIGELDPQKLAHLEMNEALKNANKILSKINIESKLLIYPPYEGTIFGLWSLDYLEYPIILEVIKSNSESVISLILCYDVKEALYKLYFCSNFHDLSHYYDSSDEDNLATEGVIHPTSWEVKFKDQMIIQSADIDVVIRKIMELQFRTKDEPLI